RHCTDVVHPRKIIECSSELPLLAVQASNGASYDGDQSDSGDMSLVISFHSSSTPQDADLRESSQSVDNKEEIQLSEEVMFWWGKNLPVKILADEVERVDASRQRLYKVREAG
ncbi:hypothetical protein P7C70_g9208, partial [Phenoliferia sp. Uapishka_3]